MRNSLVVIAIAVLVAIRLPGLPNKAADANEQVGQSKPVVIVKAALEKQAESNCDRGNSNAGSPEWYAPIKRPEWWLVILGFGSLGVVGWQNTILRRSVAVAEKSAETTSQQVAIYVNAERARMTIVFENMGRSFVLRAKNIGRATGKIVLLRGYHMVLLKDYSLPAIPPYLMESSSNKDFIEWVKADSVIDFDTDDNLSRLVVDLSDTSQCEQIRDGNMSYWVFGRICYSDGITAEIRETRFCYEASVDSNLSTNIVMSGPAVYRLET